MDAAKVKNVFYMLFFVFLTTGNISAHAQQISQNPELPTGRLSGIWISPACDELSFGLVYTKNFVLEIYKTSSIIKPLNNISHAGEILQINTTPVPYQIKLTNDGILMQYYLKRFEKTDSDYDPFANKRNPMLENYVHCARVFVDHPIFHEEGLAALNTLSALKDTCGTVALPFNPSCQQALFASLDEDENETLSYRELALAYRKITYIGANVGCDLEEFWPANTAAQAPLFAAKIVTAADQNKDRALSLHEIMASWHKIEELKTAQNLLEIGQQTGYILDFIPVSDKLPQGCNACYAGHQKQPN